MPTGNRSFQNQILGLAQVTFDISTYLITSSPTRGSRGSSLSNWLREGPNQHLHSHLPCICVLPQFSGSLEERTVSRSWQSTCGSVTCALRDGVHKRKIFPNGLATAHLLEIIHSQLPGIKTKDDLVHTFPGKTPGPPSQPGSHSPAVPPPAGTA